MDDYVSKPIRPALLTEALGRAPSPGHRTLWSRAAAHLEHDAIVGKLLDGAWPVAELRELPALDRPSLELLELYLDDAAAQLRWPSIAGLERGDARVRGRSGASPQGREPQRRRRAGVSDRRRARNPRQRK